MSKPVLRIFSNLARTGGTLVSRCIGSMDGVALLSEIHPYGAQIGPNFNVLAQAKNWYQLFQNEQPTDKRYAFNEILVLIAQGMEDKGLQLVVRDWVHLDFMAVPFISEPYYHSRLVESLQSDFDIVQYHLVRHPVSQWLSTNNLAVIKGRLSLQQYLQGYYHYACLCVANGYVRYEDFTHEPELIMRQICEHLRLDYDPGFVEKWANYNKITGDTDRNGGAKDTVIKPTQPLVVDASLYEQLHSCDYYRQSLELLGYDDVRVG